MAKRKETSDVHYAESSAVEFPQLVTIVSRDARVRANAAAMGYVVRPVQEDD